MKTRNRKDFTYHLQKDLDQRKSVHRFRFLDPIDAVDSSRKITIKGKSYINFSSNDYLNLSNNDSLKERSIEFTRQFGTGSSSSRLITGSLQIHHQIESRLATLYQKEKALLMNTGFQANSTILPAITGKEDVILADRLCHNSILSGALASKAEFYRFRHNDLNHLETFLKRKSKVTSETWIVTESLFSMTGDRAPLQEIIQLAKKYSARLYVDDAHAFGVLGKSGLGYGADYPEIDLIISTFGKAGGSFGAFVVSSTTMIEYLVNYCSGFIYSTALPPSVVGSIDAALDLIPAMEQERDHLRNLTVYLHTEFKKQGFKTSTEASHILPVILGSEEIVLQKSKELKNEGLLVTAIRPPTVPEGESMFRFSLTSEHSISDCNKLLTKF